MRFCFPLVININIIISLELMTYFSSSFQGSHFMFLLYSVQIVVEILIMECANDALAITGML